ncbi:putative pentatricopeptide repeat-containing protein, mitochondrial-like [Capsicum annuum]|nr:putative pentatricopeptide repeat-containing protein, mitochondrial-like [Capsicum annuum]
MEIDKAIRECDDRRLKTKYNNAIYVIKRALALYSVEEVALSFNGGKDSTVLLHLLRAGCFLHQAEGNNSGGKAADGGKAFPIRTIYFESQSAFPEINSFTYEAASIYDIQMDIIRLDFKSGLEALLKANPIRAIFLGVRIGDPTAVGQEQFSPSSPGWPPFMRVNPILDWSYRYTSIGSIHDTVPNALLCMKNSDSSEEKFKPAYLLADGRLERAGRVKKNSSAVCGKVSSISNGLKVENLNFGSMLTASIIAVGDEILFGTVEDKLSSVLCKKLHSIGWAVSRVTVTRNDIDSVAEEVERRKSTDDMVFIYGGIGPLHSDVTVAGVAKAFGVRMAPDEEFEEHLRHLIGEKCSGDKNEMALLPEGITELLHHEQLRVPLIKCHNVIILTATNAVELDRQWDCLIELAKSNGILELMDPFVSKCFATTLSDVEIAQPLSKLCAQFPDLYIGKSIVFPAARPTFSLLPVIITLPVFLDMKEAIAVYNVCLPPRGRGKVCITAYALPSSNSTLWDFTWYVVLRKLVKLLPCGQEVTGSSLGNSLWQKCKVRLRTIQSCGGALSRTPCIAGALVDRLCPFMLLLITGKVVVMWLGGHGFKPRKQPLAEMQGKAAYNTLL